MAVTVTALTSPVNGIFPGERTVEFVGTIALTGNYATGGISADFQQLCSGIFTTKQPLFVRMQGIAGYFYEYDYTNKKIIIRTVAAVTPAGTISKPSFTITKGAILASSELGLSADALNATVNNDTIAATFALTATSPVGTPTFTGTAQAASALAELAAAALPAGVTGDTIRTHITFPKLG